MKTIIFTATLFLSIILNGCKYTSQNKQTNTPDSTFAITPIITHDYYFAGEYLYQNNKATLQDYATGSILIINKGEIASQLEREYLALKLPSGEKVSVCLYGKITSSHHTGHNSEKYLDITRILRLNPENKTLSPRLLTGDYITYIPNNIKPSERFTFSLHPDYTYTFSIYNLGANSTRNASGTWHLLRDNEIQFTNNSLTNFTNEAFINNDRTQLTFKFSKRIYYKQE